MTPCSVKASSIVYWHLISPNRSVVMVTLVPVSASPPGPEAKCMYVCMQASYDWMMVPMSTFYLTKVTVVTVPRMSCCCWYGVWTQNYTVWLKFCHFPNCKTVTRNWILFVTRLTRLLEGFIELGLNRTWIHSNFLNIWTIANPVTVVRNHLQSAVGTVHPAVCRCDNYKSRVTRDTWHWSPWPEHSWHHHRDQDPVVDVPSERIEETMNRGSLGSLMKFT